uniref:Uncharacterized protein n=1 Tax=Candidatus Kentrum sp. LPFa TaxID=2126335 RepID=A0A450Y130_9GAMM|nr:MAG: hypothetical protein BECKLPF1236A_GA0070988_103744 [Candidatus Kentron sp. LPFa]VFK35247.1 MAG: hypothetical protein BECKLPF1236C_GA0070990_103504 [Candidatus Kentron sp. LPFa]
MALENELRKIILTIDDPGIKKELIEYLREFNKLKRESRTTDELFKENILALRARIQAGCSLRGHRFLRNFYFSET